MRRALRHVFTLLSALSLLLCVATGVLWVRSFSHLQFLGVEGREQADGWQRGGVFGSASGLIGSEWWLRQNSPGRSQRNGGWDYNARPAAPTMAALRQSLTGFVYNANAINNVRVSSDGHAMPSSVVYKHALWIPHWSLALAAAIAPAAWTLRRRVRGRRRRHGFCTQCGYDLRASPERCPECGTARKLIPNDEIRMTNQIRNPND